MDSKKQNIPALTGLRFVAALSVAIAHAALLIFPFEGQQAASIKNWVATSAGFGMTLFFVLSGFVIHYNYRNMIANGGTQGFFYFMWMRFARLYPLFILFLGVDVVLGNCIYFLFLGNDELFRNSLAAIPYYLTFSQSWTYQIIGKNSLIYQIGDNIPVTWSISTEWLFYLLYPLICFVITKIQRFVNLLIVIVCLIISWSLFAGSLFDHALQLDAWAEYWFGPYSSVIDNGWQDSFVRWLLCFSPYIRIGEFILGCLTAQLYLTLSECKPSKFENLTASIVLAASIISIPILVYVMYKPILSSNSLYEQFFAPDEVASISFIVKLSLNFGLAPSVALIIFYSARYETVISQILSTRIFMLGGEASYSIYLIHIILLMALKRMSQNVVAISTTSLLFFAIRFIVAITIIVLISIGLSTVYEMPTRRLLRRLIPTERHTKVLIIPSVVILTIVVIIVLFPPLKPLKVYARDPSSSIQILSATYGASCGAPLGNATTHIQQACWRQETCNYTIDVRRLGDPAAGCNKSFSVEYQCPNSKEPLRIDIPGEAGLGTSIYLSCKPD
ncbi:MAG: acyltransferase [Cyanobacteria bacterium]|nr:acyltransferase [Cyanobacteriota bacterium]MDW8200084.1 acyltransferase family protein [Cyanobacteriota bacterium SKYGB_h_bin112]